MSVKYIPLLAILLFTCPHANADPQPFRVQFQANAAIAGAWVVVGGEVIPMGVDAEPEWAPFAIEANPNPRPPLFGNPDTLWTAVSWPDFPLLTDPAIRVFFVDLSGRFHEPEAIRVRFIPATRP